MLKRKFYNELCEFKKKYHGTRSVMVDGARRIGKTFLIKEFAKNEYKSHIYIDFGNVDLQIKKIFEDDSANLDLFFSKLSAFYGVSLFPRESVIVLDEIQLFPRARQLIKYFVADGRYDFIESGSLITLKKNTQDILIPSEEKHLEMFPLDFEEFLWAIGEETLFPFIKQCYENKTQLGQALHKKAMNCFREYMLVGGLPQSVNAYVEGKNFENSDETKRDILTLYRNDILKFALGYEAKVMMLFDNIPGQLTKKEKKYKLSSLEKDARMRSYEDSFAWLDDAHIVNPCYNSTDPSVGLALSKDNATQKIYMADTGLLVTLTFADSKFTDNEFYKAVLFDKMNVNEGMLMENIVAQSLRRSGHKLFFYSRVDGAHRENNIEIDFLIKQKNKICPVEVKSSVYKKHTSLDKFKTRFKKKLGTPYILYTKDLMVRDGVAHLPIYMAELL